MLDNTIYDMNVKGNKNSTAAIGFILKMVYRSLKSPYIICDQNIYTSLGVLSNGVLAANMKKI